MTKKTFCDVCDEEIKTDKDNMQEWVIKDQKSSVKLLIRTKYDCCKDCIIDIINENDDRISKSVKIGKVDSVRGEFKLITKGENVIGHSFVCCENDNIIQLCHVDGDIMDAEFHIGHCTGVGGWVVIGMKDMMKAIGEWELPQVPADLKKIKKTDKK